MAAEAYIGIDCRFASAHAGLGTYTRSVVSALLGRSDPSRYVLFVRSPDEAWLSDINKSDRVTILAAPFAHYSLAEQSKFPWMIKRSGCDRMLFPHFNVPLRCPVPFICTVHDLILHRFPNQASILTRLAYRYTINSTLRRAQAIIVISQATADEITQAYGASISKKLNVVYPIIDSRFHPAGDDDRSRVGKKYALNKPFLLYVGNCKPHKNVPVLMDAFRRATLFGVELVLVCSGRECDALALPADVRRIASVDARDLPALYSLAVGCVTATLAEGFCLPLAEAMACQCPVLATAIGPIPEVCGDHALLVEPTAAALAAGMHRLLNDPVLRAPERLAAAAAFVHSKYAAEPIAAQIAGMLGSFPNSY